MYRSRSDVNFDRLMSWPGDATFAKPGVAAAGGLGSSGMTGIPGRILPTGFMVIDVKMKPTEERKGRWVRVLVVVRCLRWIGLDGRLPACLKGSRVSVVLLLLRYCAAEGCAGHKAVFLDYLACTHGVARSIRCPQGHVLPCAA